jgi:hypothetical protein
MLLEPMASVGRWVFDLEGQQVFVFDPQASTGHNFSMTTGVDLVGDFENFGVVGCRITPLRPGRCLYTVEFIGQVLDVAPLPLGRKKKEKGVRFPVDFGGSLEENQRKINPTPGMWACRLA